MSTDAPTFTTSTTALSCAAVTASHNAYYSRAGGEKVECSSSTDPKSDAKSKLTVTLLLGSVPVTFPTVGLERKDGKWVGFAIAGTKVEDAQWIWVEITGKK